jgi:Tol biopolymer transport system component/DNA-binding winged helix-turn-helix (wHTH) protein
MSSGRSSINSQQNLTAPNPTSSCIYEFEDFRLDAAHLMLYKNGTTVSLKPKVVETLVALIERRGELISKDELMNRLWPDSFVEEANLSQNIYLLRKTLGNCAGGQPVIETFWRRGYRFNCKVRQSSDVELFFATHTKTLVVEEETIGESERNAVSEISQPVSGKSVLRSLMPTRLKSLSAKPLVGAVVLIFGSLLIFSAARFFQYLSKTSSPNKPNSARAFSGIKISRLTPDLNILSAAISPDGKYLVYYDWNESGKRSLWIKDILSGSGTTILPPRNEGYYDMTFSPDGAYVYYNTWEKGHPNKTIFRVPFTGGEPQPIAYDTVSPLTFSPDQQRIAFVRARPGGQSIILANSDGSGEEKILSSRGGTTGYESWGSNLSWSPDGKRIAICGGRIINDRYTYELIEVNVADGSERIIASPGWNYLDDVAWLSDQSGLIVRARETHASPWQIWHVSYPNGDPRRITNDLNDYDDVSLSADSRFLVVNKIVGNWNIWLTHFQDTGRANQITFGGTAADGAYGVAFTSDGEIMYTSPRDGNTDLWAMNTDGSEQRQLTKNAGELNGWPSLTPDGRFTIFVSTRSGTWQIWRMDADGGNPQQLTHSGIAQNPFLSPDGAWIYFTLLDEQNSFIARIAVSGGEPTITKHSTLSNVFAGPISPDGKLMCVGFYDTASKQPWKKGVMSVESGELLNTFDSFQRFGGWTEDSKSLIVVRDVDQRSNLWLQPIDGSEPRQLTKFEGGMIRSFAVSPDFKQIAISRGNPSAEAILISNF